MITLKHVTMGRLNRSAEEMLKENHMDGLRRADMKLPGAFPGRQPCVGKGGYKGFSQGLGVKLILQRRGDPRTTGSHSILKPEQR